ncbi:hypothetical protein [Wenyingzhuangia sp. 2_MG-2023]|uniref:hypothetical protein n=1 Tax=Wenyingzhuangia sp. 2_MG-2023 TaxID=3062639 RepID=UPI0026E41DDB|nr:hypothetical protein [Wenyingzhuangia sp. 2_MG-2023]MDO6737998.1 hypothetical protein [Wenyingzhuangia sp. 2_MG-2023]
MIAIPTTPNPQKTLYVCKSQLDAYQIKNAIQRIAPIGVVIDKTDEKIQILVDETNFKTANLILQSNIRTLSRIKNPPPRTPRPEVEKPEEVKLKVVARKSVIKMAVDFIERHLNLNNRTAIERSVLS